MDSTPARPGTRGDIAVFLIVTLAALYAVSQFLRNSIGVIALDLARELSLTATQIGLLSSTFFFSFAAAQIPVGIAIDRYGPKHVMLATALLALAGTVLFAAAPSASLLIVARGLMGLGCSTFLMAPLVIYARRFPPERFAMFTSLHMGLANLGTLCATAPLAASAALIGWRPSFLAVAGLAVALVILTAMVVPRDRQGAMARESWASALRGVAAAVRVRSFWPVFFMHLTCYSCFATMIGLWGGPWLTDVYGVGATEKGGILLLGAVGQMGGLLLWGTTSHFWADHKRPVITGSAITILLLGVLVFLSLNEALASLWFVLFGLCIAFTPILTAHGKSLFPAELTGRGITLMNTATIGGAFLSQSATGMLMDMAGRSASGAYLPEGYRLVFAFLGGWMLLSLAVYWRAIDPAQTRHAPQA
jgi:MFS family permease